MQKLWEREVKGQRKLRNSTKLKLATWGKVFRYSGKFQIIRKLKRTVVVKNDAYEKSKNGFW